MNKIQKRIIVASLLLLIVPAIMNGFRSGGFNWSVFDFVIAFVFLSAVGLMIEFLWRKLQTRQHKIIAISATIIFFIVLFVELAVGIFNSPIAGN